MKERNPHIIKKSKSDEKSKDGPSTKSGWVVEDSVCIFCEEDEISIYILTQYVAL